MKIIYDSDNNFENSENESYGSIETQDVEITFDSKGKPQTPVRPKPNLTTPSEMRGEAPATEAAPQVQNIQNSAGMPVYTAPVQLTPEQWSMMMAQFAAMQQGAAYNQQVPPIPGEVPYQQVPYQPFVPYQPAQPIFDGNGQNPQTRVLYQSADFEMNERTPVRNEPAPEPVFRQEMDFEEEN